MRWALIIVGLLLAACSGADPGNGLGSYMYIQGAQRVAGAIDTQIPGTSDPYVVANSDSYIIAPGMGKTLKGRAGQEATMVAIGFVGDSGHWVVPVGTVDQATGDFTFSARASFAVNMPQSPLAIAFQAITRDGIGGPVEVKSYKLDSTIPQGEMVVSLDWDTQADLDLRVTIATSDGGAMEIGTRKRTSLASPAPGEPDSSEEEVRTAAHLDMDSNSQCLIDGRRQENVVWPIAPQAGQYYVVRVDTFSLCGEATAHWRVRVLRNGEEVPETVIVGQSMDVDTRFAHGTGAGVQALAFQF